jgi:hypothetical protein
MVRTAPSASVPAYACASYPLDSSLQRSKVADPDPFGKDNKIAMRTNSYGPPTLGHSTV